MADESFDTVSDDEYIYRRIPVSTGWYNPATCTLAPEAFTPIKTDLTGLSVTRAKFISIKESAGGKSKTGYYVAVLRVGDLRMQGIDVVSKPLKSNPGHAEIPGIIYQKELSNQAREWAVFLAHKLTLRVEGPFITSTT
jgi:hypothetical protein